MKRNRKVKTIGIMSGIVISICIIGICFLIQQKKVQAQHTLPGIETIVANNGYYDPYVILEVVKDKADASLGYLIGGEEPIVNAKSVKDYSTEDERAADFPEEPDSMVPFAYSNLEGKAFDSAYFISTESGSKSVDIKGEYVTATGGYYDLETTPATYSPYNALVHTSELRYDLYAEFLEEESISNYIPTFTLITASLAPIVIDGETYENFSKFEVDTTNASVVLNATTDLTLYEGEKIFDVTLSGYVYKGVIRLQESGSDPSAYVLGADGERYLFEPLTEELIDNGYKAMPATIDVYQLISFTSNPIGGNYYISSFIAASGETDFTYEEAWILKSDGAFVQETPEETAYIYDSAGTGTLNWKSDYTDSTLFTYSYNGGFTNYEWIKKNVFNREDSEIDDLIIDVQTVTMSELNAYNLDFVDMVYFAGIDDGYGLDLSDAQAMEIATLMKDDNFPVLMNRSVYDFVTTHLEPNPVSYSNMNKLEILLTQINYDIIDTSALLSNWGETPYWSELATTQKPIDTTYGYNYVNQSFYMYDDTNYAGTGAVRYVNADFLTAFSEAKVEKGFALALDEIRSENFYIEIAGYSDTLPVEITKASAMRYIINYGYKRNVIKTRISVLEIEPCYSYQYSDAALGEVSTLNEAADNLTGTSRETFYGVKINRKILTNSYIAENWATQFIDNQDKIELTQTYTGEFIGKIEDLNESYDLIYIGLDTSTMNTELEYNSGTYTKSSNTLYNNEALNGLVYLHSGDYLTMTNSYVLRGLLNPENVALENTMEGYGKYALSGNDITLDKYNALCEYMDAGYPIIFADGFYNLDETGMATSVNTLKIDEASYMYRSAKYALDQGYFGNNVNVDGTISNDITGTGAKETLAQYLNISKLSIELATVPTAYDGTATTPAYLTKTGGNYVLEYQFRLKDDSAVMDASTNYNAQLYIDSSVDGRFYSDEEIIGLKIYELKDGSYVPVYQTSGKFQLEAGKYYKLMREVPTGYVGVLPWKLILSRNDNELVRKSINGYTAIATPTINREEINVLQLLATSDYANNNWNLESNVNFGLLLDQVQDFEIIIEAVPVSDFIRSGTESDINMHYDYLDKFDMIIIGFSDGYSFSAPEVWNATSRENLQANAALAIRKYISEGRSVLFTHDTTSYCNTTDFQDYIRSDGSYKSTDPNRTAWLWGYDFNRYVRDIVGMDRYGVLRKVDGLSIVDTVYDKMWTARTDQAIESTYPYTQGYSNQTVVQYASANDYVYTTRPNVAGSGGQYGGEMDVTKTNEGQITRYPFDIPAEFQVTNTHRQYYQLNLDTDSKDSIKDDDIVVWYCISDVKGTKDIYETNPNDVRNNYYIYNKGNVTYSGVGHSTVLDERVTEMKLFVNTMVAAYNAGVHPPRVTYKDGEGEDAGIIEYLYLPYDEALDEYVDKTADIYFDIADTSFAQGTKEITANYYLEVSAATGTTTVVTVDGKERYLEEFSPTTVTNVRTGVEHKEEAIHTIENDATYKFTMTADQLSLLSKNRANIYIGAKTTFTRASGSGDVVVSETQYGYYKVAILKMQLFELE